MGQTLLGASGTTLRNAAGAEFATSSSRLSRADEVARQFEGLFLAELWRAMQKTLAGGGPFGGGGSFGLYGELMGQELVSWLAEQSPSFLQLGVLPAAGVGGAARESATAPREGNTHRPYTQALGAYQAQTAPAAPGPQEHANSTGRSLFSRIATRVLRHDAAIRSASEESGLDPSLVRAVVHQESGGDPLARSPKGALGLMQLVPATAREMGLQHPFRPGENIRAGVRYLRQLVDRFGGDIVRALAAYNAGPETVVRAGGVPDLAETRAYVPRVLALAEAYRRAGMQPADDLK